MARRAAVDRRASACGRASSPTIPAGAARLVEASGWRAGRGRARSARSASTTTTTLRRATCSRRSFASRSASRGERTLPIVIHTREAEEDTFRILDEEAAGEVGGVFHCFTGDRAMARRALDAGFHLSLAGIVTFPRATELHEVAKMVPLDRLLIETDSPFLAPVPHRGTRNEPARVVHVAEAIARAARHDASRRSATATQRELHATLQPVTATPATD